MAAKEPLSVVNSGSGIQVEQWGANDQRIVITGEIDARLKAHLENFDSIKGLDLSKETILVFDNPGGSILAGLPMGKLIGRLAEAIQEKSGKRLHVVIARECHSMCTAVFAHVAAEAKTNKALQITVPDYAIFGFHAASSYGQISMEGLRIYLHHLMENGVSREWLIQNAQMFTSRRITEKTAAQLYRENSGILDFSDIAWITEPRPVPY